MANDFLNNFFTSQTAKDLYGKASRLFFGATWVPSPWTDQNIGKEPWKWWSDYYNELKNLLEDYAAKDFKAQDKWLASIRMALEQIMDPQTYPPQQGVTKADLLKALGGSLEGLKADLTAVMKVQRDKEGLDAALKNLIDASFTVAMGAVAMVENAASQQASFQKVPFNETFNELFLRDRTAALYESVGDPPQKVWFGSADTPSNYASQATSGLNLRITIPGKGEIDVPAQLEKWVGSFQDAQTKLQKNPSDPDALSQRREAVSYLATLAQELGKETQRLSVSDAQPGRGGVAGAADAAALSAVFAEGMRGVLGLQARRQGRLTGSVTMELVTFGEVRAAQIRQKAKERDDPLDPSRYGDAAR